jgi:hypothetical protein
MSEKEIKLSPEIRELADKFKAATKVEKDGTSEVETDVFTDTLKEGITKEIVESVYEHRDNCIRAGQLAAGELFVDAMSKNASLDKGTVVYGLGGSDSAPVHFSHNQIPFPMAGNNSIFHFFRTLRNTDDILDSGTPGVDCFSV